MTICARLAALADRLATGNRLPDTAGAEALVREAIKALTASIEIHPGSQAIAERIAEELFVNGAGQEAHRLVLTSRDGRDLGGWSKGPFTDRIVGVLASVPAGVQVGKK